MNNKYTEFEKLEARDFRLKNGLANDKGPTTMYKFNAHLCFLPKFVYFYSNDFPQGKSADCLHTLTLY